MTEASHACPDPSPARAGKWLAPSALIATLCLTACGPRNTDEILRGGVPAMTNLPRATSLPPAAVRTVSRREFGWRVIYHPASAPANADQQAAVALCRLESRRVERIEHAIQAAPLDDPGARMIDIFCA
ncbi:hypothetical protein FQV27_11930 [Paracoccus aurantiacus]|uniref:Uncharacterized protein n=1 Tax=Paracoccus aurantiacus TaxID=2599412 RepID=A0A5C6S348_9RHOB|nr:hypothetical protein [Paracoccus aurantiacus]TXB68686.1 hypothetical protein FQV27_11930 [Paracoccus aurantiacus]